MEKRGWGLSFSGIHYCGSLFFTIPGLLCVRYWSGLWAVVVYVVLVGGFLGLRMACVWVDGVECLQIERCTGASYVIGGTEYE